MNRIYLDHAAATPVSRAVLDTMAMHEENTYGNPSSIHKEGLEAKKVLDAARVDIAGALSVRTDEIIFTSSATESCNLGIIGAVRAWKQTHKEKTPHDIVSAKEHDAV